ncbi:MAG: 16S rRNA (guanine(527)-N(7))-methyltransferase RsmG [Tractidigestivibacter sp.]|jgi:16S rRNA (guanine527-N7)-methyltransferase|uniref:16S rRNA (guanine(527)-N(7))-methyltransferase RsmG n=1 Tax=Tractidigestivibacter sp. TaxID=2847320 RepID=UPI003D8ED4B3
MEKSEISSLTSKLKDLITTYPPLSCLSLSDDELRLMVKHLALVIEKNKVMNLTRILDPDDALVLHILDSLLFLAPPNIDISPEDNLLDIGTGAGFPGIPLTIATGCHSGLLDSVGKKVKAVEDFSLQLGLSKKIDCFHCRAEELPNISKQRYQFVVARAVAPTNVLVEYASPLLNTNGFLLVSKGNPSDEEISSSLVAADICGLKLVSRETYELPSGFGHREIIIFMKEKYPKIKLPRKVGMAKNHPLGI